MRTPEKIVALLEDGIRQVYGKADGPIPLHAPCFKGYEWEYVKNCLDNEWVSSVGEYVDRFEQMVADFTSVQHAVATVNGTAAIHIAILLAGVETEDEVLCPAFSFVATVSPIIYCHAYPVFMDSDPKTLGMDVDKLTRFLKEKCIREKDGFTYNKGSGRRIRACIPMHAYGYPVDMEPLLEMCNVYKISVIEDAAEALGSYYGNHHCGTLGKVGVLSFNGNKVVTTGGGGMILTDDEGLAKKAKHLTTTAKVAHPWEYTHDEVGYNYRMPNLNAALGCAQMENLDSFLTMKKRQAERFKKILAGEKDVRVIQPESTGANHWFNLVRVPPDCRDEVLRGLNSRGIQARTSWIPVCDMQPYVKYERFEIDWAKELSLSFICLPNGLIK
jgi:perosamine synthetase